MREKNNNNNNRDVVTPAKRHGELKSSSGETGDNCQRHLRLRLHVWMVGDPSLGSKCAEEIKTHRITDLDRCSDLEDASDGHGAAADISGSVLGDTSGWFFLNYSSLNDYF